MTVLECQKLRSEKGDFYASSISVLLHLLRYHRGNVTVALAQDTRCRKNTLEILIKYFIAVVLVKFTVLIPLTRRLLRLNLR